MKPDLHMIVKPDLRPDPRIEIYRNGGGVAFDHGETIPPEIHDMMMAGARGHVIVHTSKPKRSMT